jgi:hypothetical protein
MTTHSAKSWISPFIALTFSAVSLTGLLMLFHLRLPGIHGIHQWGGVLFTAAGVIHLIMNWPVFLSYFKSNRAMMSLGAGVIVLLFILAASPSDDHRGDGRHGGYGHENHETIHGR